MSNSGPADTGDVVARYLAPGGANVRLIYILYLASLVVGVTILIGLVIAYLNLREAIGTWAEGHYTYQIRTFWIGLVYSLILGRPHAGRHRVPADHCGRDLGAGALHPRSAMGKRR